AILTAINSGAQAADKGSVSLWSATLFVVALFLFVKTQHYILITATAEIEAIIHKLRLRLMDHVRHSELLPLESIGRGEIVSAITKETSTLTQMSNTLAFAAQSETFKRMVFLQSALYGLLGAIAFAVPTFGDALGTETVTKTITALVFVVGTCFGLVQAIPIMSAANTAADNIERLEARLLATIPKVEIEL